MAWLGAFGQCAAEGQLFACLCGWRPCAFFVRQCWRQYCHWLLVIARRIVETLNIAMLCHFMRDNVFQDLSAIGLSQFRSQFFPCKRHEYFCKCLNSLRASHQEVQTVFRVQIGDTGANNCGCQVTFCPHLSHCAAMEWKHLPPTDWVALTVRTLHSALQYWLSLFSVLLGQPKVYSVTWFCPGSIGLTIARGWTNGTCSRRKSPNPKHFPPLDVVWIQTPIWEVLWMSEGGAILHWHMCIPQRSVVLKHIHTGCRIAPTRSGVGAIAFDLKRLVYMTTSCWLCITKAIGIWTFNRPFPTYFTTNEVKYWFKICSSGYIYIYIYLGYLF